MLLPRKQLGTTRCHLDSELSGSVVPTSSRHVITHGLTKGNSIGVENGNVLVLKMVQIKPDTASLIHIDALTTSA